MGTPLNSASYSSGLSSARRHSSGGGEPRLDHFAAARPGSEPFPETVVQLQNRFRRLPAAAVDPVFRLRQQQHVRLAAPDGERNARRDFHHRGARRGVPAFTAGRNLLRSNEKPGLQRGEGGVRRPAAVFIKAVDRKNLPG